MRPSPITDKEVKAAEKYLGIKFITLEDAVRDGLIRGKGRTTTPNGTSKYRVELTSDFNLNLELDSLRATIGNLSTNEYIVVRNQNLARVYRTSKQAAEVYRR